MTAAVELPQSEFEFRLRAVRFLRHSLASATLWELIEAIGGGYRFDAAGVAAFERAVAAALEELAKAPVVHPPIH